jgi:hypothetical protein
VEEDMGGAGAPGSGAAPGGPYAEPPATGDPRVDEALRRLGELPELPTSEHPGVFEQVHSQLVDVLGELRPGDGQYRRNNAET